MSPKQQTRLKALIVRSAGTNCDQETAHALDVCGADSDLIHINQIATGRVRIHPYQILVIAGGFSYGDDISAGKVLANQIRTRLKDQLQRFIDFKKPVIGICNGFQVLVKTGLLPGFDGIDGTQQVTLAQNDSGRFQCEWTGLKVHKSAAEWMNFLPPNVEFPIAHGEGKFITKDKKVLQDLKSNRQIVFTYSPNNPNGSEEDIAGICNKAGNVIGLMPHPERYISFYQHPNWSSKTAQSELRYGDGYWFWKGVVDYARTISA